MEKLNLSTALEKTLLKFHFFPSRFLTIIFVEIRYNTNFRLTQKQQQCEYRVFTRTPNFQIVESHYTPYRRFPNASHPPQRETFNVKSRGIVAFSNQMYKKKKRIFKAKIYSPLVKFVPFSTKRTPVSKTPARSMTRTYVLIRQRCRLFKKKIRKEIPVPLSFFSTSLIPFKNGLISSIEPTHRTRIPVTPDSTRHTVSSFPRN